MLLGAFCIYRQAQIRLAEHLISDEIRILFGLLDVNLLSSFWHAMFYKRRNAIFTDVDDARKAKMGKLARRENMN